MSVIKPVFHSVKYTCPWCGAPGSWRAKELPPTSRVKTTFWCKVCKRMIYIQYEFGKNFATAIDTAKGSVGVEGFQAIH